MARNVQENGDSGHLWAESAARAGYTVHNDLPRIGVSGDEGEGYIVPVPAPEWFNAIGDEGTRDNVFRALAGHALRVGQAKLKQSKTPDRQVAIDGVAQAVNGGYKPAKDRKNDIVDAAAMQMFTDLVRERVKTVKPDATDAQIESTVLAKLEEEGGKAKLDEFKQQIVERGTYTVNRKGKGKAGGALDIGPLT